MRKIYCYLILLVALPYFALGDTIIVDDFEDVSDWTGLERDSSIKMEGDYSGIWRDTVKVTKIRKNFNPPLDLSGYDFLGFWVYSENASGAKLQLVLDSDNPSDPAGWDYYSKEIVIDFSGWKFLKIPLSSFVVSRNPVGWNKINYISFNSTGWNHTPLPDTVLRFDFMVFSQSIIELLNKKQYWLGNDFVYEFHLIIKNKSQAAVEYSLDLDKSLLGFEYYLSDKVLSIPPSGLKEVTLLVYITPKIIVPQNFLKSERVVINLKRDNQTEDVMEMIAAVPLMKKEHPYMLLDSYDILRIAEWANKYSWAKSQVDSIIKQADNWESNFKTKYGVAHWELPPEGGQWGMWYVCKDDNSYLTYTPPMTHKCPKCGKTYSGWPYDQVIYARMHNDLAKAALRLAQSYRLTKETRYATEAKEILLRYSQKYLLYPIHDKDNKVTNSGGRVLSQTLDESAWFLDMAWAYELLKGSGIFSAEEERIIENSLLYEGYKIIERNKAGKSNWQSWHNVAMTSIGLATDDFGIIATAINDDANGFLFQLKESISPDGFWYEGSWGYHFFALRPLVFTSEMMKRAGMDFTSNELFLKMFTFPIYFSEPDGKLPPFNDSGVVNIREQKGLYEFAYKWTNMEIMTLPLDESSRPYEALFWGSEKILKSGSFTQQSLLFQDSGYIIARTNSGNPNYLAADFGPHGGWHGHYDKLGFVFYALGKEIAVDAGTHSYALPIHDAYDRTTVAHNTVVVDSQNQKEISGDINYFQSLKDLNVFKIGSDNANDMASLSRKMILTDNYLYDKFICISKDGAPHKYDYTVHLDGVLSGIEKISVPYSFVEDKNGYQYLRNTVKVESDKSDFLLVDYSDNSGGQAGSVWTSESGITASFVKDCSISKNGRCSGKMSYDFSSVKKGYVLYTVSVPNLNMGNLLGVSCYIKGDKSNNSLKIRITDSTDERFVYTVGNIDFDEFRKIEAVNVEKWSHYQGNNDGKIDYPVKSFVVEVGYLSGGELNSSVYIDDIMLNFEQGEYKLADFEIMMRYLGISSYEKDVLPDVIAGTSPVGWGGDVSFIMKRKTAKDTVFRTLFCISDSSVVKEECRILSLKSIQCTDILCDGVSVRNGNFIDYILFKETNDDPDYKKMKIVTEDTSVETDGLAAFLRKDGFEYKRSAILNGSYLSESGLNLLDYSGYLGNITVDYEDMGNRLNIEVTDSLSSRLRIFAPLAQIVLVNGIEQQYSREGDYVVLNDVVIGNDELTIEDRPDIASDTYYETADDISLPEDLMNDVFEGDTGMATDIFTDSASSSDLNHGLFDTGLNELMLDDLGKESGCSCSFLF